MNELWIQLAVRAGLTLSASQREQLSRYLDLLLDANQRMNLTRITDRAAAELHHIADSLTVLPFLPHESHALADVGSGGGAPGIPLAIVRPDARVTLIESTKKKAVFLESTVAAIGLTNVSVMPMRVEDVGQSKARETFDIAVVRAVATMVWLAEWCLPLVKKGGKVLAMKGPKVAEELPEAKKAIQFTGGGEPVVHPVELPGMEHHVIVEIPKLARTDAPYPRSATSAKGNPLT